MSYRLVPDSSGNPHSNLPEAQHSAVNSLFLCAKTQFLQLVLSLMEVQRCGTARSQDLYLREVTMLSRDFIKLMLKVTLLTSLVLLFASTLRSQMAQNPSPMVEHTRPHPRLRKQTPRGQREQLDPGTLFIPAKLKNRKSARLLFFFHGGNWLPEVAVARRRGLAVVTIQAGGGSGSYERLFENPKRFPDLIAEAERKSKMKFSEVELGGWSAGCFAIRKILGDPASYRLVRRVLCIDGVHTGYVNGHPGPKESSIQTDLLQIWLKFGRDALAGKKHLIITHSEIFPGTFASTTETADYLLREWGLQPHPVVKWGPMKTQMLSEVKKGNLLVIGFAGNSAPDHVDQFESLPEYLKWLMK